jgi:hypothetical protein
MCLNRTFCVQKATWKGAAQRGNLFIDKGLWFQLIIVVCLHCENNNIMCMICLNGMLIGIY